MRNNDNIDQSNDNNDESLLDGYEVPPEVVVDNLSEQEDINDMNSYFLMKKRIYEETLAPELKENEKTKRNHKDIVVNKLFKLLKWQFIATYIFTFLMITMISLSSILSISNNVLESMFSFMKFYITSILAELVAILFFIVKQVFDKSIVELFKNFDKDQQQNISDNKEQKE